MVDGKDPFGQQQNVGTGKHVLRARANAARTTGHLNIAAMGLKEIPPEIMAMYDFDPENNSDWYENVDLVKFIAADNELESLAENVFPDFDVSDFHLDEAPNGGLFGGVEVLDLHGNMLNTLPPGLRRLQRLNSLNLSHNKLSMDSLEIVSQIEQLTDLKLANNDLRGPLASSIGLLRKLEVLDVHGNSLTEAPHELSNLTSLRMFNASENQFVALPAALTGLPLVEINMQKNKLKGYLFPESIKRLDTLQVLDVSVNALDGLSAADELELPNLQQLAIDVNRVRRLPNVASWSNLLRVTAADNDLSGLPDGITQLKNIRVIDVTANSIGSLDEKIGLMDGLVSLRVANNPLRERKLLTMDTEDLKLELRNRCESDIQEGEEEEGSVQTEFTLAPESPTNMNVWRLKPGGVLDRSSTEITDLDPADVEHFLSSNSDVRCLYLRRNRIPRFPEHGLSMLAHSLHDLDLSHNPFKANDLISTTLLFPHLQNLTLVGTGLVSLQPLLTYLSAPSLTFLDVSNNKLTGPLPMVRQNYSNLMTFLAADNQIDSLGFDAVQGLQVLDVSNNNIDYLPPLLGMLSPENIESRGPALKRFEVAGNCFRVPRYQIVAKGTEAVLEWLKTRITEKELEEWRAAGP